MSVRADKVKWRRLNVFLGTDSLNLGLGGADLGMYFGQLLAHGAQFRLRYRFLGVEQVGKLAHFRVEPADLVA